jgi:hypothetical protein
MARAINTVFGKNIIIYYHILAIVSADRIKGSFIPYTVDAKSDCRLRWGNHRYFTLQNDGILRWHGEQCLIYR